MENYFTTGVIDKDYTGEVQILFNYSEIDSPAELNDQMVWLIFERILYPLQEN